MSNYKLYEDLANLLHAVRDNDLSFIKANIRSELVNLQNSYHISLLKYAVIYAKKDIVEFLFEQQDINHNFLDHNILDDKSWNVLHNAAFLASNDVEHLNLYKYLLKKGVNPHQKSLSGLYPFQTRYNYQNLCKQLWELTEPYWKEDVSPDFKDGIAKPIPEQLTSDQPKSYQAIPQQSSSDQQTPEQQSSYISSSDQSTSYTPSSVQATSYISSSDQSTSYISSSDQQTLEQPSSNQTTSYTPSSVQQTLEQPSSDQTTYYISSSEQQTLEQPSSVQSTSYTPSYVQQTLEQPSNSKRSVMLFCGQGSQKVGMLSEYVDDPIAEYLNSIASQILEYDLMDICINGPESKLNQTDVSQPALLLASIIQFRKLNIKPSICAGFSLGEYSALVASGAISFEDGIRLLKARGEAMLKASESCPSGMISVVGLEDEVINEICETCNVSIANYLFPKGRVLSGKTDDIKLVEQMASSRGATKVIRLQVSGGFHSAYMESAAKELKSVLADITINQPSCIVYSNVTGEPYTDSEQIRQLLSEQITKPVQWQNLMNNIAKSEVDEYFEVGIGSQLKTMSKRINEKEWNKFVKS